MDKKNQIKTTTLYSKQANAYTINAHYLKQILSSVQSCVVTPKGSYQSIASEAN